MTDYLDAELDDRTQRRVDRHVRFCPRCRRVLGNLRATIDRLAHLETPADYEADHELDDELVARINSSWRNPDNSPPPPAP